MLDIEKAAEAAKIKQQIETQKYKRRKKRNDLEDLETAINKLQKKRREIEEGLQETANTISRKIDRITGKSKFRVTYYEKAKSMFLNSKSSRALEHTKESERIAKKKLFLIEDDIEALNRSIKKLEKQLEEVTRQIT